MHKKRKEVVQNAASFSLLEKYYRCFDMMVS